MNVLEKDNNKENKMVLVYVYKILAYHKKAYDLYTEIYNKSDRKQKSKLFNMEQMSKKHGDNNAIRFKMGSEIVNEELNDVFYKFSNFAMEYLKAYSTYKQIEGATIDEISAFEKDFGIILPDDFKEYYEIKNGSGDFKILHTPEFNGWNQYLLLPLETIRFLLTTAAFCSKKYLPFAVAGMGGNSASHGVYLAFDFYPTENGKERQIIRYVHDDRDEIDYVASTFSELLEKSKNNLKKHILRNKFIGEGINNYLKRFMGREGRIINIFLGF
jgi:cell wall assembly regulator SMI1